LSSSNSQERVKGLKDSNVNVEKTVLLIGNFFSKVTGSTSVSEELALHFHRYLGWNVLTASCHAGRVKRLLDIVFTIVRRQREYHIANIEVYSGAAFILAEVSVALLFLLKKPFILTLHGGGLPQFANQFSGRVRWLLQAADSVTTPSLHLQQNLKDFRDDIVYLPNGIALERYPFRPCINPAPNLCWLRAFHEIYNPALAINVLILLREKFPDIQLTMIGPDKRDGSLERVKELIEENQLSNCVQIIGPVSKKDVPVWLAKGDIFINTTSLESFGVAVMEAASVGLPIVSTSVGELPLLWSNEEDALLVPVNDAHQMAEAISRILTEPGLAEKLSRNARMKAERYDWKTILPEWEKLLHQTIENSRNRKQ
jgi:glycosyltransferase involved in cell wall biosynthesis